jgi:hypothetical protein
LHKACISASVAFWRHVRLALVVVIVSHPHRLICLGVIFLSEWRVYGGSALFDPKLLFYSLFSFSFLDCVLVMQKIILVLQFIFSFDLVSLLLFAIVLFTLIISNWILFSISSLVICFFICFQIWFTFF